MKRISNQALIKALKEANTVLVCTHLQPDGDAIGSALAALHLLEAMGKKVVVSCQDPVPGYLQYLKGSGRIIPPEKVEGKFDMVLSVDASDRERLGRCAALLSLGKATAQIDHHATNTMFADLNEVDSTAAATGMLIMRLCHEMGIALDADMASCLYAAISSDTGNFMFSSVTAEAFEQMRILMDAGLPLSQDARRLHLVETLGHMRLLGAALRSLTLYEEGRIAQMSISLEDFSALSATKEEADGIVNHGLYIQGVEMAYLATETQDGIKFSLRSVEPHIVSRVALKFGGGGHAQASGCTLHTSLKDALMQMQQAMAEELHA